jgi:glycerophosphoryl diester phosphodiesterase
MTVVYTRLWLSIRTIVSIGLAYLVLGTGNSSAWADSTLVGRAILPAETFAKGPTSGTLLGESPINGVDVPFEHRQPVQGFSAVLNNGDGTLWVMSDNGFGSIENSSDYHLRVYRIRPKLETARGGRGKVEVLGFLELSDPDRKIPFAIVNHFSKLRILTGADFDIESMRRARDGTLWFGDEFGPFLLHTDAHGKVLEPPIPLPDFEKGGEIRSPQNPFNEEGSPVRIMNAVAAHARQEKTTHTREKKTADTGEEETANTREETANTREKKNSKVPVCSPWHVMLDDEPDDNNEDNEDTVVENRAGPQPGSGLKAASSEIFNVASLHAAGFPVVVWTVNDKARMLELMALGVDGIISDSPDLLRQAVEEFDANGDGTPGDYLTPEGLIDLEQFDAQGHRGGRNLRPENTLPAMEVALDFLMSTLELDTGITADGVPLLDHDPSIESAKAHRTDGIPYGPEDEVLVKDLTAAEIQSQFIADRLLPDRDQTNDLSLSPVSVAFAESQSLAHPYVLPTLQQVFDFVEFYARYYESGPGSDHADAERRSKNARRVRFNIETKINPREEFAHRTIGPEPFAKAVAKVIKENGLEDRADIQSFDFRTLLVVHEKFGQIRTVCLFGDFPIYDDPSILGSDDGTNLQPEKEEESTPWLAGLFWPYRITMLTHPFRAERSGGFEGMAITPDNRKLLPLLEKPLKPLVEGEPRTLLIHEFDIARRHYTGTTHKYPLDSRATAIGDFTMFDPKRGLIIERDDSQGTLDGFKAVFEVKLQGDGEPFDKQLVVDLLNIADPRGISEPGQPGDVGIGEHFAFPFTTIESVYVLDRRTIGVLNDNNFPFSVGRHVGSGKPDDNELILIRLEKPLSAPVRATGFAFDTSTYHNTGQLATGLSTTRDQTLSEVIRRTDANFLLTNELDFDTDGQTAQHHQPDLLVKLREAIAKERILRALSKR